MDKWFIGISGALLALLLAINDVPIAMAIIIIVCDGILLFRNRGPQKTHFRLVLWGQFFGILAILTADYLYAAHVIPIEVYTLERRHLARGFMMIGTFSGMCYCLYKYGNGNGKAT